MKIWYHHVQLGFVSIWCIVITEILIKTKPMKGRKTLLTSIISIIVYYFDKTVDTVVVHIGSIK